MESISKYSDNYKDRFFKRRVSKVATWQPHFAELLYKKYQPQSVIDFGCGTGEIIDNLKTLGAQRVVGLDIGMDYAKQYASPSIRGDLYYGDATNRLDYGIFDLSICLEVAEHIPTEKSDILVSNIANSCKKGGMIIFSAAIKGQRGTGHINCQDRSFWIEKFTSISGVSYRRRFNRSIKRSNILPAGIARNLMVFAKW